MRVTHKKVFFALSPACLCFALVIITCLSFLPAYASGELDVSFGTNGLVSTDFGNGWDEGNSVVIDGKDRIVVAGCASGDFALACYDASGNLDPAFGGNGLVSTDFGNDDDAGYSVAIDGEGRIVVAGYTSNGSDRKFALARYTASGTLDPEFGSGGLVSTDFGNDQDEGYSVAIDEDDRIVVAGCTVGGFYDGDFALARYIASGDLDTAFSGDGLVSTDFGDCGISVAIDGDGRIVVAGRVSNGRDGDFALARYIASGDLDTAFSGDGFVSTDFGDSYDVGKSVAIDEDGRIVVAGRADGNFALARYIASGVLDDGFGMGGLVSTDFGGGWDCGESVVIDSKGRIVVAGCASGDFALARYTASGDLDTDFGSSGLVSTDFGNGDDWGNSVAIDGEGRIVVAGCADGDFALARYIGTDEDTGDAGSSGTASSGTTSSGGCSVATLPGIVALLSLPLAVFYRKIK